MEEKFIIKAKEDLSKRVSEKRFNHTASVAETALRIANHFANLDLEQNSNQNLRPKIKATKEILNTDDYIGKIEVAAWLHDSCKEIPGMDLLKLAEFYKIKVFDEDLEFPNVLHARIGAAWVEEEYGIKDPHILHAIEEHTLGGNNMLLSSKILYLADMLEPNRDAGLKTKDPELSTELDLIRNCIFIENDLDKALIQAMNQKIIEVLKENKLIHPLSVESRNCLVLGSC